MAFHSAYILLKYSLLITFQALDKCYGLYKSKVLRQSGKKVDLNAFDAVLFHSPFCKLVQKSLARLAFNDFKADPESCPENLKTSFANVNLEDSYFNKDVEKAFMEYSLGTFQAKTKPSLHVATNVGNMYTPSLYGGLVSFICSHDTAQNLIGKQVALFSYGSGLASSFYSIRVKSNPGLEKLHKNLFSDVLTRLNNRRKVDPEEFDKTMKLREDTHHLAPYNPVGSLTELFPGTWYLESVDDKHRRKYLKTDGSSVMNGTSA